MKLNLALLSLFAASGVAASSSQDANIQVLCKGIQHTDLSAKALAYSAKAVEITYNAIYKEADGEILQQVAATGIVGKGDGCKNCGDDFFEGALRAHSTSALSFNAEAVYVGKGDGCKNCGDDEIVEVLKVGKLGKGDGCKNCGDDEVEVTKKDAWEAGLTAFFAKSPFPSLQSAKQCMIKTAEIIAKGDGCKNCGDDAFAADIKSVSIDVHCGNVDFAELPVSAITYSMDTLQETYNSIYDGSSLDDVALGVAKGDGCKNCGDDAFHSADLSFFAKNIVANVGKGDGCKNCGDDMVWDASTTKAHEAWEDLFLARLLKDSKHFKSVKNCMITMKENSGDVAVQIA